MISYGNKFMNIIYFGYDFFFDCLDALINEGHTIMHLYTIDCDNVRYNFNTKVRELAKKHGIPVSFSAPTEDNLIHAKEQGCDLLVSAAYGHKIPISDKTPRGINIHPTLLPEGRGRWPPPWIILKELPISGITFHALSPEWDKGNILAQYSFPISPKETLVSLNKKIQTTAQTHILDIIQNIDTLWEQAKPQSKGSYWPMPTEHEWTVDWHAPLITIEKTARAFGPFGWVAEVDNTAWLVQDIDILPQQHTFPIGSIVARTDQAMTVAASDGLVILKKYELDI